MDDDETREGADYTPLKDSELLELTHRLTTGWSGVEAEAAVGAIVDDFFVRTMNGLPQSPVTLQWIADALHDILYEGIDPSVVLRIPKRPRHRPPDPMRNTDVAVWLCIAEARGYNRDEAEWLAAECFHYSQRHIRRLRDPTLQVNFSALDAWERHFLAIGRALPSPSPSATFHGRRRRRVRSE